MMELGKFVSRRGIWTFHFGLVAFVFSVLLLFASSLPEPVRRWTIPSLGVYLIGLGFLIFIKELIHIRYREDQLLKLIEEDKVSVAKDGQSVNAVLHSKGRSANLPGRTVFIFGALEFLWLVLLIAYNWCKGAL